MANDMINTSGNPFLRAADQLRTKGAIDRKTIIDQAPPVRAKARLNFIPDSDLLHAMIDRALEALSKGLRLDRGAILNIVV
jgi:hypothetical protein